MQVALVLVHEPGGVGRLSIDQSWSGIVDLGLGMGASFDVWHGWPLGFHDIRDDVTPPE